MVDADGNLVVVAEGRVHPCATGVMHNSQNLLQNHYKVSVDKVYEEHGMVDLPVPSPDGETKLSGAKNMFLQWPCSMVLFDEKVIHYYMKMTNKIQGYNTYLSINLILCHVF